ncbi:MAG: hypothetical protein AAFW01_19000 [Pseudomonadota bacterium]
MPVRLVRAAPLVATIMLLAGAGPEDLEAGLARCATLAPDAERLACFDELAKRSVAHVYAGKGGGTTAPFSVDAPRLLHFESGDVIMVATLLREDGTVAQNLHLGGRGTGRHLIEEPGTYRVQVNASGSWRIWLTEISGD